MNQEINQELLFLYWSGLASPLQKKLIETWLENPSNQELYFQWLLAWEDTHPQALADSEHIKNNLFGKIDTPVEKIVEKKVTLTPKKTFFRKYWIVAASVVLLLALAVLFQDVLLYKTYQTEKDKILDINLPDGSRVVLNTNSALKINRFGFGAIDREVWLTGEADFAVTHQKNKQKFIVQTSNKIHIEVLGTEFMVTSRENEFRVALHSGSIRLQPQTQQDTVLQVKQGDVVTLTPQGQLNTKHAQETRILAEWRKAQFIFDRSTLAEVVKMIEEKFNEKITIEKEASTDFEITGRFLAESPDDLLETISEITGYQIIKKSKNMYVIR